MKGEEEEEEKTIKVILIGESGVGKTSIIYRYVEDIFNEETLSTISVSSMEKRITLNDENNKKIFIKFEIWDTCGQEKYRNLAHLFYKGAQAAILVYDSTSKESFEIVKSFWYEKLKENSSKDIGK